LRISKSADSAKNSQGRGKEKEDLFTACRLPPQTFRRSTTTIKPAAYESLQAA